MSAANSEARKRQAPEGYVYVEEAVEVIKGFTGESFEEIATKMTTLAYEEWEKNRTLCSAVKALKSVCIVLRDEYKPDDPYTLMLDQAIYMAGEALEKCEDN